jgi:hypothetical protein
MVTQREVLSFIAEARAAGRWVGVRHVGDQFWLSSEAAAGHLRRLWRERLIEPVLPRPTRFRFRLEPGESIAALSFRITPRGRQRLRWYARADDDGGGLLFR